MIMVNTHSGIKATHVAIPALSVSEGKVVCEIKVHTECYLDKSELGHNPSL